LPNDSTLIVVRVFGRQSAGVMLVRADAGEGSGPDSMTPTVPVSTPRRPQPQDVTYVFAAAPGHWRLTGPQGALTSFCLGAPGFDVAAGDIVFAGSFALDHGSPPLDMSLEPARAALSAAPALAERVRAANYVNGDTFECGGGAAYLYAYEIDGAPFREGYTMGSRATATVQSAGTSAVSTESAVPATQH
jgi:hypothetical protein